MLQTFTVLKYLFSLLFVLRKICLEKKKNKEKQRQNSNLLLQEAENQVLNSKILYFFDFILKGWIILY